MAPYDIPEGTEYGDVINNAIKNAACLVLLLTEDAQNSTYVDKEIERALHYGKTIAPIQLGHVILNDSFSFYLCNQQIEMVSALDESLPKLQKLLKHLHLLCNNLLPEKELPSDEARDKRVRRKKISRLLCWSGIILLWVSLLCGDRYIHYSSRGTYEEMYGAEHIPELPEIAQSYILFFFLSAVAVFALLYGYGLRNPRKKSWNPLHVIPSHLILPAVSVLCGTGYAMMNLAQQSVARIVWGLEAYRHSAEGYSLPLWVMPATQILAYAGIISALLFLILAFIRGKRNGFPCAKKLYSKFRNIVARRKKGDK